MIQSWWSATPMADTKNPPAKQQAAVTMALRGPTRSSQVPKSAAERPRKRMAMEKIQAMEESDQSPAAAGTSLSEIGGPAYWVMPMSFISGILKTEKA